MTNEELRLQADNNQLRNENGALHGSCIYLGDQLREITIERDALRCSLEHMRKLNRAWKNRSRMWELRCHLFQAIAQNVTPAIAMTITEAQYQSKKP